MAHFAELDSTNKVIQVVVVSNQEIIDENGNESEAKGIQFCQSLFGGNWIQTSYNGNFRKRFAAIGSTYDKTKDAFILPKPEGDGWILDEETLNWINPDFSLEDSPYI